MQTKKCSCSPIPKPISEFRKRIGVGDGYQSKCIECEKKALKSKPVKVKERWDFVF